jgi:hypothetical protein
MSGLALSLAGKETTGKQENREWRRQGIGERREGSCPPVCGPHGGRGIGAPRGNQNRRTHGLYSRDPGKGAELSAATRELTLWREIGLTRVVISEVLAATPPESWDTLPLTLNLRAYHCMLTGHKTVARLKLTEKKIKRMKLPGDPSIFQTSAPSLDQETRQRQSFYWPGRTLGEVSDSAGDLSLIDAIAHTRQRIDEALVYWQERGPDVAETVALANAIFRSVNQVHRLVQAQLAQIEDGPGAKFDAIFQRIIDEFPEILQSEEIS